MCILCHYNLYIYDMFGWIVNAGLSFFFFFFFIWQYDHLELKGEKRMARKFLQAIKFTNIYSSVGVISRYLRHKCPLSVLHVCL